MPNIETLIPDIHGLLIEEGHQINEENFAVFMDAIESAVRRAIQEPGVVGGNGNLRLSKSGTGLRRVWYDAHREIPEDASETPVKEVGENLLRFLSGHVIEALLLLLAKEAGHSVEYEQEEVEVEGIIGHNDAVIDGHMVDIKTASQFSFDKFKTGDIKFGNDPFGYMAQISSYKTGFQNKYPEYDLKHGAYFWAYNKSNSEMVLTAVGDRDFVDSAGMLRDQKRTLEQAAPPPTLCYPEEDEGKGGNKVVNKNCTWCPHFKDCYKDYLGKDLRAFKYSNGVKYFTHVEKEPRVEEIKTT